MRTFLIILYTAVCTVSIISQEVLWSKNYGGSGQDLIYKIKKLNDSTFIGAGYTLSNDIHLSNNYGKWDGWLISIDGNGKLLWSKNYGGSESDIFHDIEIVNDGIIVLGSTYSNDYDVLGHRGNEDVWLLKTDFKGNIIWSKNIGSEFREIPIDMLVEHDGSMVILAQNYLSGGDVPKNIGGSDLWFIQLDNKGIIKRSVVLGGTKDDGGDFSFHLKGHSTKGRIVKKGENYIVLTASESSDGNLSGNQGVFDNWVLELNKDGLVERTTGFGGSKNDLLNGIFSNDRSSFLFGNSDSEASLYNSSYGENDFWIYKYWDNDSVSVINNYGGSSYDYGVERLTFSDNTHTIAGYSSSKTLDLPGNYGYRDGWLLRLDKNFKIAWSRNYGGSADDLLFSLIPTKDYGIIAAGLTFSNDFNIKDHFGEGDAWIMRIKDTCVVNKYEVDTFICAGSYLVFHGDTVDQGGVYRDTISAKRSCDSIITWNVDVKGEEIEEVIYTNFCKRYTLPGGKLITESGIYYDTLTSVHGCDSTIEYNLQRRSFKRQLNAVRTCEFYEHHDGRILRSDGVINDTIYKTIGCDSIYTYKIDIRGLDTTSIVLKKEEGQTIQFRDTTITIPGQYIYRQNVAIGCDSIYLVEVKDYKECELYTPNAFTPDGDGINDWFAVSIENDCHIFNFHALIYDRWGQLLSESRQPLLIWDGKGHPTGVYIYAITYEMESLQGIERERRTGTITLLR